MFSIANSRRLFKLLFANIRKYTIIIIIINRLYGSRAKHFEDIIKLNFILPMYPIKVFTSCHNKNVSPNIKQVTLH